MAKESVDEHVRYDPEPRWPAAAAVLAIGGLYAALPQSLIVGPRWMFFSIMVVLLIPTIISHRTAQTHINNILDKLKVKNRTQAVVKAIELGILESKSTS